MITSPNQERCCEKQATKREHISDVDVCLAVAKYQKTLGDFPYQTLARQFSCSEKLAYSACERTADRGLIECGVSLRTGWLTETGKELIKPHL